MKLLISIAELLLVFFFLRMLLGSFFKGKKKQTSQRTQQSQHKRFDDKGADISDADFKEIR